VCSNPTKRKGEVVMAEGKNVVGKLDLEGSGGGCNEKGSVTFGVGQTGNVIRVGRETKYLLGR